MARHVFVELNVAIAYVYLRLLYFCKALNQFCMQCLSLETDAVSHISMIT